MTVALPSLVALALAAAAAFTDWRTGTIPNRLTLPVLALAPVAYLLLGGVPAALASLLGALLCGAVPYLLFRRDAIGGGDVKLLAALGAVLGASVGLEAELLAFVLAALWALGASAARGGLWPLLRNALRLAVNPLLPRRRRLPVVSQQLTSLRLGAFVLAGLCTSLALQHYAAGQG
jgi:prepilin peptidase CpaA